MKLMIGISFRNIYYVKLMYLSRKSSFLIFIYEFFPGYRKITSFSYHYETQCISLFAKLLTDPQKTAYLIFPNVD